MGGLLTDEKVKTTLWLIGEVRSIVDDVVKRLIFDVSDGEMDHARQQLRRLEMKERLLKAKPTPFDILQVAGPVPPLHRCIGMDGFIFGEIDSSLG